MKIIKQNIMILMSAEEVECLEEADKILYKIQDSFPDEIELECVDTGELIGIEEIARVRGILDALCKNVEFKKR